MTAAPGTAAGAGPLVVTVVVVVVVLGAGLAGVVGGSAGGGVGAGAAVGETADLLLGPGAGAGEVWAYAAPK